jgi:hypothetical protein
MTDYAPLPLSSSPGSTPSRWVGNNTNGSNPSHVWAPGRIQNAAAMQPTWESPAAKKQTVEDQRRSTATVANTVAKPLDGAPTQVDNSGISAQRTGRDGRSWSSTTSIS